MTPSVRMPVPPTEPGLFQQLPVVALMPRDEPVYNPARLPGENLHSAPYTNNPVVDRTLIFGNYSPLLFISLFLYLLKPLFFHLAVVFFQKPFILSFWIGSYQKSFILSLCSGVWIDSSSHDKNVQPRSQLSATCYRTGGSRSSFFLPHALGQPNFNWHGSCLHQTSSHGYLL